MTITDRSGGVASAGNPTMTDRRTGIIAGIACKAPCRSASTAALTLSGEQSVDGVACVAGNRVLVKDQVSTATNGVYVVSTGLWARATDFDSVDEIARGTIVAVSSESATVGNSLWFVSSADPTTVDSSAITFTQFQATSLTVLTSTDGGAAVGPTFDLYRDSASPLASDFLASVDFNGRDSAGNKQLYARLMAQITDPTTVSEDAILLWQCVVAGVLTTVMQTSATGVTFPLALAVTGTSTFTGKVSFTSTDSMAVAKGTTAQRNVSPTTGDTRYNSTLNGLEYWNGTAWIVLGQAPTVQRLLSGTAQTYTAPAGVVRQRVRMVGPGAGGSAATTNSGSAASADTSFQVNASGGAWTAVKGAATGSVGPGGAGGSGGTDGSTGTLVVRIPGGGGQAGALFSTVGIGGIGGNSALGGGGRSLNSGAGAAGATNSGAGGAGGSDSSSHSGGGAGAGEYVEFWVTGMTTATYTVPAGGVGGPAGGNVGGNGAAGIIIVEEFYS